MQTEYFVRYRKADGGVVNTLSTWPTAQAAAGFIPTLVELVPGVTEPTVMRRTITTQPVTPDELQATNL